MKIAKRSFPKILSTVLAITSLVACLFSSVSTVSAEVVIYTETGETYHELANFDSGSGGAPVSPENGYSSAGANSSGKGFLFTVPAGDVLNLTDRSPSYPHVTFTENAEFGNAKYVQFYMKNTSADPVYIYNFNIRKDGVFQYRVAPGSDVQLIAEDEKTVVNAARWAYVTIGTTITNSRAIKIPAGFTGYVRLPISAESLQIVAPSGSSFDTATLAQADTFNFQLGSIGAGGKVYIDDVGFITGGDEAKAGAAFADLSLQKTYTDENGNTMAYRLYLPENYDSITKYPVVLYLHGNGFQGADNLSHVTGQIGEPLDELVSLGNRSKYPCIVVAPQCPTGDKWVDTTFANGSYSTDTVAETAAMGMVLDLLDEVLETYNTDADRVYAMGVSMGAFACWDMMVRHPGLLAAAVPMMGAGDPTKASAIGNTAVWAFHCANDNTVPASGSQEMVAALQALDGTNVTYTEYTGLGHAAYRFAIAEEELLPWMFSQNDIYYDPATEVYTSISGFETDDAAMRFAAGATATDSKNTGAQSHKITVGDATNVNAQITFLNSTPKLAGASYVQFWVNNTAAADQYIAALNFLDTGIQFNVPAGKQAILIDDATETAQTVTYANVKISGLGTIRTLCIPAGFSGYVRISLAESDLEIKAGTYGDDALNSFTKMSFYLGNTSTGGDFYVDDFGFISPLTVEPDAFANEIVIPRTHFSADESFSTAIGTTGTTETSKQNGYFDVSLADGKYFINPIITTPSSGHMDTAEYVQFTVNNDSDAALYIFNFNLMYDNTTTIRYRFTTSAQVWLIDAESETATATSWVSQAISGAGTTTSIKIPAGFNGKVRFSLDETGIEKRNGNSYAEDKGSLKVFNFCLGNPLATAATVTIDDVEIVDTVEELPAVAGAQIRTSDNNLRFVMMHSEALLAALEAEYASVEYGTVVVNASAFGAGKELLVTDKTTGFGSSKPTTLKNTSSFVPEGWEESGYSVYSFVITNLNTDAKKATPIAVRAYIKVTDEDGGEHVLYSYDKYAHGGYQTTYNAVAEATAAVTGE